MRRILVGITTSLAIWLGSALAAEAQSPTITGTGPSAINAGDLCSTYTGNVYLPTPCVYRLRLTILTGPDADHLSQIHYSETVIANPGIQNSTVAKIAQHTAGPTGGSLVRWTAQIKPAGGVWTTPVNWDETCGGTRPSSKSSAVQKSSRLALQSVDRDRRRE